MKLHTQTSGRSLIQAEFKNNLTRTAVELMLAYMNATNSCHSTSADEPFTTPGEEYVRLAAQAQGIILEETGLFKYMMNTLPGSPGMKVVEKAVDEAMLAEFREIDRLCGVLAAVEQRYQRSQIQQAAFRYESQIYSGVRPIIGLNRYAKQTNGNGNGDGLKHVQIIRTPVAPSSLSVPTRRQRSRAQTRVGAWTGHTRRNRNVPSASRVPGGQRRAWASDWTDCGLSSTQ